MIRWLKSLFAAKWPVGEPLLRADGFRWGTRMANGSIVPAPGVRIDPWPVCPSCGKQLNEAGDA
jgi:hypothetical protein